MLAQTVKQIKVDPEVKDKFQKVLKLLAAAYQAYQN